MSSQEIFPLLKRAISYLREHGVESAEKKAEELVKYLFKCDRAALYAQIVKERGEKSLEKEELLLQLEPLLERVAQGEPIEYVTGSLFFYECQIAVNPTVLIPRVETEILLDKLIQRLHGKEGRALDLCTGSGCLAIALKKRVPRLEVWGADLSPEALKLASFNAEQNEVDITWRLGDLVTPLQEDEIKFDIVISNPPYISLSEFESLSPSVKEYEPAMALIAGAEGVEFYLRLAKELPSILSPGALVYFEIGAGQGSSVLNIFSAPCWGFAQVQQDWAGHPRFFSSIFLEGE